MSTNARNGATAERLVEALCDLPLADWRRVALAAVADRRAPLAKMWQRVAQQICDASGDDESNQQHRGDGHHGTTTVRRGEASRCDSPRSTHTKTMTWRSSAA